MAVIDKMESAPVARVGDHGEFEAWAYAATALGRQGNPAPNESVEFLINRQSVKILTTNNEGWTDRWTFTIPAGSSGVVLGVQIAGEPTTYIPKTIMMPTGIVTQRTADNWKVNIIPDGNKRSLFIRIFTQNNIGVPGVRVFVTPDPFSGVELITDNKGVIGPREIAREDTARTYTVIAPETNISADTFTIGRRPRYRRPQKLTPQQREGIQTDIAQSMRENPSWNPWKNFQLARRKANELLRNRQPNT